MGFNLDPLTPGGESLRCLLEDDAYPVGADSALQPRDEFAAENVSQRKELISGVLGRAELADEQLDVIVDFAGAGATTGAAVDAVGRGGRVVLPGMAALETTISTKSLIMKQVALVGSLGASKDAQRGVYELMATGDLSPVTQTIPFEEIAAGLARLSQGGLDARLVARIGD